VTTIWTIHVAVIDDGAEFIAVARVGEYAANGNGKSDRLAIAEALARLSLVLSNK
jgi:hypothetical protein